MPPTQAPPSQLPAVPDGLVEYDETFIITLVSVSAATTTIRPEIDTLNDRTDATILDSTDKVLSLQASTDFISEFQGTNTVTFTVRLSQGVTAVQDITTTWRVDCSPGIYRAH